MTAQQTRDALLLAPTPPGTAATGSVDEKLNTIEGVTNQIGNVPVTINLQTAVLGSSISVYNAVDIDFNLTGLTDFTGWSRLLFTAKNGVADSDGKAIVQLAVSSTPDPAVDGLLVLQGNQQTKTDGSLTVTGTTQVRVQISASAAVNMTPGNNGTWDIKVKKNGKWVPITEGGSFAIVGVVTDAIA